MPLVPNQRGFGWISDQVAGHRRGQDAALVVGGLRAERAGCWCCWSRCSLYLISTGVGVWGLNHPGDVGLGHHQLRLVDRHRPRRAR